MTSDDLPGSGATDESASVSDTPVEDTKALKKHVDTLLKEKKTWQAKAKDLETQIAEIKAQASRSEASELDAKGDTKKLLELERTRAKELADQLSAAQAKLTDMDKSEKERRKASAVASKFEGGLDSKWMRVVAFELDDVVIDPETGEVDQISVDKVVRDLKATYPEMVRGKVAGMPKDAPKGSVGRISLAKFRQLPLKEQEKYTWDMVDYNN